MRDQDFEARTPAYDLLQSGLAVAFQEFGNGERAIGLARSLVCWYTQDMGREGNISLGSPLSSEEKLHLEEMPDKVRDEVLRSVSSGKSISSESISHLRGNFPQGKALIHLILAVQKQAKSYAGLRATMLEFA